MPFSRTLTSPRVRVYYKSILWLINNSIDCCLIIELILNNLIFYKSLWIFKLISEEVKKVWNYRKMCFCTDGEGIWFVPIVKKEWNSKKACPNKKHIQRINKILFWKKGSGKNIILFKKCHFLACTFLWNKNT